MNAKGFLRALFFLCTTTCLNAENSETKTFNNDFIHSFVKHYEFNLEGRYTHEYHPFLLEKTAESFDQLEQHLGKEGLDLAGRMVIFGYEENAVPSYYTNFCKPTINDEAILKNNVGWSVKLHNRFGIITGFLFKDFNELCAQKVGLPDAIFEHINPQSILVFDDMASIFQEHAFGEALGLMNQARDSVTRSYVKNDIPAVLEKVVKFWQMLYTSDFRVGNKQFAGTQDILFSVEYLKHLIRSPLPFIKFFTGPDITYPIEISCKQEKGATLNAQAFVKTFVKKLQPVNDQATVYIFCSFVDGVGKSTMLGNIKNWMKYGDDCDAFDHVDNTSSQLYELFKFKDNVYIADLPAQISHFSYKPDGVVFVDAKTEYKEAQLQEIVSYAQEHKDQLIEQYRALLPRVQAMISKKGYFAAELCDTQNISSWFVKNLFLLHKEKENRWIPFSYQNKAYLFHADQPWDIRVLQPLSMVKSEGLKNIAAEQMFFNSGVRFPLVYREFLSALVKGIKDKQIGKVVFVDFLSMYPRSSRENIRINYLQQQMALFNKGFDVKYSLYRDFVSGGELLQSLLNRSSRTKIADALELESLVRLVLSNIIDDARYADNLKGIELKTLTELIDELLKLVPAVDSACVHDLVAKKLKSETAVLDQTYGLSKPFVNIQQFKLSAAMAFSDALQQFFTEHFVQSKLNNLWEDCGDIIFDVSHQKYEQGYLHDVVFKTQSGRSVRALYALTADCKNESILTPALRLMRSQWFMALCNLFYAEKVGNELYRLERDAFWVPPLLLKNGPDGLIYLVQPVHFDEWDKEKKISPQVHNIFFYFNVDAVCGHFGAFDERPYLLDWNIKGTQRGIYAFDCDLEKAKKGSYTASIISLWVNRYQVDRGPLVFPASDLYEKFKDSVLMKSELEVFSRAAVRNGEFRPSAGAGILGGSRTTYSGDKKHRSVVKKLIRFCATLNMVVKDPDEDIVVRYGNRDDFKAAIKLFEQVTLPKYFGMYYSKGLFKRYDDIQPYPSWSFWDEIDE